ncbi:unnamed protein product [marine sediment metagenome]|uniref:Uncharacterized protein n=1 Tax=marine sediment metagenome TaxID=412755 RepID=X0Z4G5_9ZZZZ
METLEELVDLKIKYINCLKNTLLMVEIPKAESTTGNHHLIEVLGEIAKRIEDIIYQEARYLNLERKYYITRRLKHEAEKEIKNLSNKSFNC